MKIQMMRRVGERSKDKAQAIVDAIYRCIQEDADGSWWMDNLKAVAIVRREIDQSVGGSAKPTTQQV